MASVPKGTLFFVASAFSSSVPTTVVTNASSAVVTAAAHGFANGDYVELLSGWGRLNKRVARISGVTTNTMALDGIDTSNVTLFPAGSGIGSVRKINTWTQIVQVLDFTPSGGDPRTIQYSYLESDVDFSINDGFNATSYTMALDADSISTPGYASLKGLTDVQTDTCMRMIQRNGALILQPCTVALNEAVLMQNGQINRVNCQLNGNNRLTRYAS